jgi:outer membrane immunogenic protein
MKCVYNLAAAALLLTAATADAADPPRAPLTSAAYDWSGFYVGGQGGGLYYRDRATTPGGELLEPISIHDGSFFAGGYSGYNIQMSNLVLGVEGDFSYAFGGRGISLSQPTVAAGIFASGTADPKWLSTISGRLGFAAGNWLIYGEAGGAWMETDYTARLENGAGAALTTQTQSSTRFGWLGGAGIEYGWSRNWLSRVEYNYVNFGKERVTFTRAGLTAVDFSSLAHVVKVGVAYKFGGATAR